MRDEKAQVKDFWNRASCGEEQLLPSVEREGYDAQRAERYRLEPYIADFAGFKRSNGLKTLEIGVGLGADHQSFAEGGADLHGIDLTPRAIEHTSRRLALFGLSSKLAQGDAENLPFADDTFDLVYSWGVLHHSPDTPKAFQEVLRVLKPGGQARVMIYSKWSLIGLMLWIRYALLRGRPFTSLKELYAKYLESPGTKAYTLSEARRLCTGFREVRIRTVLTHGDLLTSGAGQRHQGRALDIARRIWPRWFFKTFAKGRGLFMLVECVK
ncbi:MAG: class I SAM-dependent methyltransferase [bacterium]|jgi:SAM-dependent methyltransferase